MTPSSPKFNSPMVASSETDWLKRVAMYEHLAAFLGGPPTQFHYQLYENWAKHDWGIIITGNVQVSSSHLSLGRDLVVPERLSPDSVLPFKQLAYIMRGHTDSAESDRALAIMQLNHSGRQSSNIIGGRFPFQPPLAPSAIPLSTNTDSRVANLINKLLFRTPRAMTIKDIDNVVAEFVQGALLALQAGFDGVELHVAHGYLLAQFVSSKSNSRTDEYSASPENALRLLHRIVASIRDAVPEDFVVGIKFNARDYLSDDQTEAEARALDHLKTIACWNSIDFIEVSGGDYQNPDFMASASNSNKLREAFFARFSHQALNALESTSSPRMPLILLTGGLRTSSLLHGALVAKHAHLLGIGRGAVICPDLPNILQHKGTSASHDANPIGEDPDISLVSSPIWNLVFGKSARVSLIGAGVEMAWYLNTIRRLASTNLLNRRHAGQPLDVSVFHPDYFVSGAAAVIRMWFWMPSWQIARSIGVLLIVIGIFAVLLISQKI